MTPLIKIQHLLAIEIFFEKSEINWHLYYIMYKRCNVTAKSTSAHCGSITNLF